MLNIKRLIHPMDCTESCHWANS